MKDISRLKSEEFETLLGWLSEDREQAGTEYNKIRDGLVRFFRFKGCSDSQTLADETFNRVAEKIPTFDETNNVKKTTIIYGFAKNVSLEHLRTQKRESKKFEESNYSETGFGQPQISDRELRFKCLNECLKMLSAEDEKIFIEYYGQEKLKKSVARRRLAESLGCEMNVLQVRIFRLRGVLAKCIEKCLKKSL